MVKVTPGNPQWIEWLEELVDKTSERGSKAAETYKKGIRSLRSCPIIYEHPEDATALQGIGPKTAEYLMKKIRAQCEITGEDLPRRAVKERKAPPKKRTQKDGRLNSEEEDRRDRDKEARRARTGGRLAEPGNELPPDAYGQFSEIIRMDREKAIAQAAAREVRDGGGGGGAFPGGANLLGKRRPGDRDDEDEDENDGSPRGPKVAKRKGSTRVYVPKARSGAFAILIGLYLLSSRANPDTFVTRQVLVDRAQEYSDTSFDKPSGAKNGVIDSGIGHYTAWSGMKTLIDKDLVQKDNRRPVKYALTDSGYHLADQIVSKADVQQHSPLNPSSSTGIERAGPSWSNSAARHSRAARAPSYDFGDLDDDDNIELGHPEAGPSGVRRPFMEEETAEERESRELQEAIQASIRESQPPSSSSAVGGSGSSRLPLPIPLPLPQKTTTASSTGQLHASSKSSKWDDNLLLNSSGSGVANRGPRLSNGLDGRKAAGGLNIKERSREVAPQEFGIDGPFMFSYLDNMDNRVELRAEAAMGMEEGTFKPTYRIEFPIALDLHVLARGLINKKELIRPVPLPGPRTYSAYIQSSSCTERCSGIPEPKSKSSTSTSTSSANRPSTSTDSLASLMGNYVAPKKKDKNAMYAPPPEVRRSGPAPPFSDDDLYAPDQPVPRPKPSTSTFTSMSASNMSKSTSSFRPAVPPQLAIASTSTVNRTKSAPAVAPTSGAAVAAPRPTRTGSGLAGAAASTPLYPILTSYDPLPGQIINRHPLDPVRDHISENTVFPEITPIVLKPGTFKIMLIVDTREVSNKGGSSQKRTEFYETLERAGVPVDRKMLPLGDMIWVARRNGTDGSRPGDDVVLDSIVERKRLDDLVHSLQDGRLNSQKLRMKDSGLSDRIYLLEKYDTEAHYEQWGPQIWTIKCQLQVNDGFYVHISSSTSDTLHYLKLRTQVVRELYENQTLYVIPDQHIDRLTYLGFKKHLLVKFPKRVHLTTYTSFENLNKSDAALTLRQQWASMIQRVNGLSGEKTVAFVERWSTPAQYFREAQAHRFHVEFENAEMEEGESQGSKKGKKRKAEDFVVETLDDQSQRAIKGALGVKLWNLVTATGQYPAAGGSGGSKALVS
ncbi:hypothetical protein T439DRAFT_307131 [Meredithblackwellia eburnea MCA 4105]